MFIRSTPRPEPGQGDPDTYVKQQVLMEGNQKKQQLCEIMARLGVRKQEYGVFKTVRKNNIYPGIPHP